MTHLRTRLLVGLLSLGPAALARGCPPTPDATVNEAIRHGTLVTRGLWDAQ
jgi:hypothetical protein